ncbi:uncharacterized protein C19orf47 homolog [Haemorhous mexicanus]|uniref:uncharacterized protein C19orf47 homolog n=1 Tax=Haemorhous mexicanus TaxID=30427 RepID=UPI0028BF4BA4|nr:uncharacterized protein C19orf47 homolog [Haemorhous mexicanus]
MATSEWLRFFEDAGIPPGPALGYAVAFVDNRIHKNMLLDLTKELMKELGITVVGDVIAILRHAKVVHRQEMCRAASESLQPEAAGGSRRDQQDHRDQRDPEREHREHRDPCGAAGRMITNSLSRDPAPRAPRNPPGAGISVTVPNGTAKAGGSGPEAPALPPKRRRVTAEAEGAFLISLPKGAAARGRQVLRPPAAPGLGRPSVFERLGAEAKAAAAAGAKPSGVFSRLGAAPEGPEPAGAPADPAGDGADPEALPYAGVLKKRRECSGTAAAAQDGAVSSSGGAWGCGQVSSSCGPRSVFRRLGRKPD